MSKTFRDLYKIQAERHQKAFSKTWLLVLLLIILFAGINIAVLLMVQKSQNRAEATASRITDLQTALDKHAAELSKVNSTLASFTNQINTVSTDTQKVSTQTKNLDHAVRALDEKIGNLQQADANHAANFDNLTKAKDALASKIEDLGAQVTTLKQKKEVTVNAPQ
jgi:chromosome segregation ATPase